MNDIYIIFTFRINVNISPKYINFISYFPQKNPLVTTHVHNKD